MRIETTGFITGRNGSFPLRAVELSEGLDGDKAMIRIDGAGQRCLINGGIVMEKKDFLKLCHDFIQQNKHEAHPRALA